MKDITDLSKRLYGYYATPRGKFLLLQSKTLTLQEYILYEASITFADWDKVNHPNTYGTIDLTQDDFELLIGKSKGFVSRYSKKLYKLGFWKDLPNGRIRIQGFELIEVSVLKEIVKKHRVVDIQRFIAELQDTSAEAQQKIAKPQHYFTKESTVVQPQNIAKLQLQSSKSDFLSSNDNSFFYGDSKEDIQSSSKHTRTDEEYQQIVEEGSYRGLKAEDMKWIDENVHH